MEAVKMVSDSNLKINEVVEAVQELAIQPGAEGIRPSGKLIDRCFKYLTKEDELVATLIRNQATSSVTFLPSSTPGECVKAKTVTYKGFTSGEDGIPNTKCAQVFSPTSIFCEEEFKVTTFKLVYEDICSDFNGLITRANDRDVTGGVYVAGETPLETVMRMMKMEYTFVLNRSVVLGDPALNLNRYVSMDSLSTILSRPGVLAISGAGLTLVQAVERAMITNTNQGRCQIEPGTTKIAVHPSMYNQTLAELRAMPASMLGFGVSFTDDKMFIYRMEVIQSVHIPVISGVTQAFFITSDIALYLSRPEFKESELLDADYCGNKNYRWSSVVSMYAGDACEHMRIDNLMIKNPLTLGANINPSGLIVSC